MPEFLTVNEVAKLLKLGRRTTYDLCRRGELAGAAKVGNQWRVNRGKLLDWMDAGGATGVDADADNGAGSAISAGPVRRANGTARSDARPEPDVSPLRPFFGYYGGKWRDTLKHYPRPRHETIVEPFAGSAGFSLRYASQQVILCERDPVVAAVWRYLIEVSPAEIRSIPDVPLDGSVDDLPVPPEAKWLVGFWMNRGTARPRKRPSKWMRDGIRPGSFWGDRVRETIASQVEAIRHWTIYECSYEDCPYDGPATWFIDPPYQMAGKHYRFGSEGIDYAALAEWCKTREGQVVVCENEGADWLPFEPLAHVKTTRRGHRSKEVVWTSAAQPGEQKDDQGCSGAAEPTP